MNDLDILKLFLSFLFAFIVKDFYDIFIQSHIKLWLSKYKILITKNEVIENVKTKTKRYNNRKKRS